MEFGYKLRELRKAKGYGLREFGKVLEKSPSYLSNIERGAVPPPSAEFVTQIAAELDGDLEELLALAKRFDMESFELIRKNANRLESAEKTIRFLSTAISLDDDDPLGGMAGILEIVVGERVLNPDSSSVTDSFNTLRFILDTAAKPDEGYNKLAIQLRREVAQAVFQQATNIAHPYSNYSNEEGPGLKELLLEILKKYPKELVEEIIKREDLKAAYHESIEDEANEKDWELRDR